jgi:hypothetical protein
MTAEIEAAFAVAAGARAGDPRRFRGPAPVVLVDPDKTIRFIKSAPQQQTVPAAGAITFDMDGPKTGYQWTVRRISVSDEAAVANSMGSAQVSVYAGQPSPQLVSPGNLEWMFPSAPNVANFGSDELVLQYGEHLFVLVTGATVGQGIICSVAYQLYMPHVAAADVQV